MLTMKMWTWLTLPWIPRRVLRNVSVIVLVPAAFLIGAIYMSKEPPQRHEMEIAALALAEDMQNSPPRDGWLVTDIRVNEKTRVEMDVEVAYHHQAEFIRSRSGRIQHSYLKLACPAEEAKVYQILPKHEAVWIHLHFNRDHIVSGACPKAGGRLG